MTISTFEFEKGKMKQEINQIYHQLGYPPRESDYSTLAAEAKLIWNSWHDFLKASGIKATFATKYTRISKEECFYKYKGFIEKHKRWPKRNEMIHSDLPTMETIKLYWSTIPDFEQAIGLTHSKRTYDKNGTVSRERIIKEIQALYDQLGYPPHSSDYNRSATAYNKLDKDWSKILEICGIHATFASKKTLTSKEEILYRIKKCYGKRTDGLIWEDIYQSGVSTTLIYKYFKSLKEISQAVGIPTHKQVHFNRIEKELISGAKKIGNKPVNKKQFLQAAGISSWDIRWLKEQTNAQNSFMLINSFLKKYNLHVNWKKMPSKPVTILGVEYPNCNVAAKKLGISYMTLINRLKKIDPNDKLITTKGKLNLNTIITLNGKRYASVEDAARQHKINSSTLLRRIKIYGKNSDKLFSPVERKFTNK